MYLYDAIYAHSNKQRYILRPRGEVNADQKLTLYLPVYKQDKKQKKNENKMFYSRSLLSRKGPLGAIWVAAYCFKRLKKAQVFETNIPSSVG